MYQGFVEGELGEIRQITYKCSSKGEVERILRQKGLLGAPGVSIREVGSNVVYNFKPAFGGM